MTTMARCRLKRLRQAPRSLELHVEAFRHVGAEAGRDDDTAADLPRIVVAGRLRCRYSASGFMKSVGINTNGSHALALQPQ